MLLGTTLSYRLAAASRQSVGGRADSAVLQVSTQPARCTVGVITQQVPAVVEAYDSPRVQVLIWGIRENFMFINC